MSLNFSLSVRSRNVVFFLSQQGERGRVFAVFFAPILEKGISEFIAHGTAVFKDKSTEIKKSTWQRLHPVNSPSSHKVNYRFHQFK